MALAWEDIDLSKGEVKIRRSVVDGKYSRAKTVNSERTVQLLDQAILVLQSQRALTQRIKPYRVQVLNEDNRSYAVEQVNFVFINTNTKLPFKGASSSIYKFMHRFLETCKLRYRGINQARHTHASQLLTRGIPERWIIKQMGWSSITMFEKTYGRWIEAELPDMAKQASNAFEKRPLGVQNIKANI